VTPAAGRPADPGSRAGLPDQFRLAFLFDGDDPPGDFGMQNHAFIVGPGPPRQQ
jgi:hypothetical protein